MVESRHQPVQIKRTYRQRNSGIDEFTGLDNAVLKNDRLEIGRLVPVVPAAAVPQPSCYEVRLLVPIEGFALVLCAMRPRKVTQDL